MVSKLESIARGLFVKLGDGINQAVRELNWRDARGRRLHFVRISTDERFQKNEPWKDIFYIKFYFYEGEFPTLVGIGSLTRNEIFICIELIPDKFSTLLHDRFFFSVIAVHESFVKTKEDCLRIWQAA